MDTLEDQPQSTLFSQLRETDDTEVQKVKFHAAIVEMVSTYFNVSAFDSKAESDKDHIRAYAREVLSLGALLLEMNDSIHEGDGERLLRVWTFLLLVFRAVKKIKYSFEGITLLIQAKVTLPPRLREQLLFSRFINTRGIAGANIPIDLHVEHVNRIVKSAVHSQSSNLSPASIIRTSRCTGSVTNVVEQFDRISQLHCQSSAHSDAIISKDVRRIVKQLHNTSKVFQNVPGRQHPNFKSIQGSIVNSVKADKDGLTTWMKGHLKRLVKQTN